MIREFKERDVDDSQDFERESARLISADHAIMCSEMLWRVQSEMRSKGARRYGHAISRSGIWVALLCLGIASLGVVSAQDTANAVAAEILSKENSVDSLKPAQAWHPAAVGQKLIWHERLRTGEDSRAAVRMSDSSVLRIDELTETEILPPATASAKATIDLKQGSGYFFSREKSREINVKTPAANGAIRGTEFVVTVAANGHSSFTMLDGEVEVSNAQGSVLVRSGERAEAEPGQKQGGKARFQHRRSFQ
jgi:hypothetical protein